MEKIRAYINNVSEEKIREFFSNYDNCNWLDEIPCSFCYKDNRCAIEFECLFDGMATAFDGISKELNSQFSLIIYENGIPESLVIGGYGETEFSGDWKYNKDELDKHFPTFRLEDETCSRILIKHPLFRPRELIRPKGESDYGYKNYLSKVTVRAQSYFPNVYSVYCIEDFSKDELKGVWLEVKSKINEDDLVGIHAGKEGWKAKQFKGLAVFSSGKLNHLLFHGEFNEIEKYVLADQRNYFKYFSGIDGSGYVRVRKNGNFVEYEWDKDSRLIRQNGNWDKVPRYSYYGYGFANAMASRFGVVLISALVYEKFENVAYVSFRSGRGEQKGIELFLNSDPANESLHRTAN